ncbi:MAG: arginine deiminase-related protein [Schleiferiaceae bacterium]
MKQSQNSLILIRPKAFGFNSETAASNGFQKESNLSKEEIHAKALKEFDRLVVTLNNHDIFTTVLEDSDTPEKPDAVFPNNWLVTMPGGRVYLFPMMAKNRRAEVRMELIEELAGDFEVEDVVDASAKATENQFLEGTGSMVFDHANQWIYACRSERTHEGLLREFAENIGYKVHLFDSVDANGKPIYHTNVMMAQGTGYVLFCGESLKDNPRATVDLLFENNETVVDLTYYQIEKFAGNALEVTSVHGKRFLLLSQTAYNSLEAAQKSQISVHAEMIPIDIPTIERVSGGSVRCMLAENWLTPK